jgi:hypothetical protein
MWMHVPPVKVCAHCILGKNGYGHVDLDDALSSLGLSDDVLGYYPFERVLYQTPNAPPFRKHIPLKSIKTIALENGISAEKFQNWTETSKFCILDGYIKVSYHPFFFIII